MRLSDRTCVCSGVASRHIIARPHQSAVLALIQPVENSTRLLALTRLEALGECKPLLRHVI